MLAGLWMGSGSLGTPSVYRNPVGVSGSGSPSGVPTTDAGAYVMRGFAGNESATAAQQASITRTASALASALASVGSEASINAYRNAAASAVVFVDALLGANVTYALGSTVQVTVSGILIPYDTLLNTGSHQTGVTAQADMQRIIGLAAVASAFASASGVDISVTRAAGGNVLVDVTAARVGPNVTNGSGVNTADMGADANTAVSATIALDPVVHIYSDVDATSVTVASTIINRLRSMPGGDHEVTVIANDPALWAHVHATADASASVTQDDALLARITGASGVPVSATVEQVYSRLQRLAMFDSMAKFTVEGQPIDVLKLLGMLSTASVAVTAADASMKPPTNEAGSAVSDTLATAVAAATRAFAAIAYITVTATARMTPNPFDLEPDFRTYVVRPSDVTVHVQPDDLVLYVRSDGFAMRTFTKQPGDVLAYDIDLTQWFASMDDDAITSADCSVESATDGAPSGLTVQSTQKIGLPSQVAKVWLADGVSGTTYALVVTINTKNGLRKLVDFKLRVKDL